MRTLLLLAGAGLLGWTLLRRSSSPGTPVPPGAADAPETRRAPQDLTGAIQAAFGVRPRPPSAPKSPILGG